MLEAVKSFYKKECVRTDGGMSEWFGDNMGYDRDILCP